MQCKTLGGLYCLISRHLRLAIPFAVIRLCFAMRNNFRVACYLKNARRHNLCCPISI